jgi:hypothetical protein
MPRQIDVKLDRIFCAANGFGGAVLLTGDTFGATFQNNPDDPQDQRARADIFPFPSGPISISKGQTVKISMDQAVRFDLSAPDLEPPELNPKFLKFGGELNNGLGSSFSTIRWDEPLPFANQDPVEPPREFVVSFESQNLKMNLIFTLIVANVF